MKIKKFVVTVVFLSLFLSFPSKAFGQASGVNLSPTGKPTGSQEELDYTTGKITNPVLPEKLSTLQGVSFLNRFAQTGISLGFVLGSLIFFFMLITGAIKYITAGGDKGRLESGQKQITHALVGLVILFCVFAIIQLVETVFGISITKLTLPTL